MNAISYFRNLSFDQKECVVRELYRCKELEQNRFSGYEGEEIETACSNALHKIYREESGLGRAVFERNPIHQFLHVVTRTSFVFRQIHSDFLRDFTCPNERRRLLVATTHAQMVQAPLQKKVGLFSRYCVLSHFLIKDALRDTFVELQASNDFWASLSRYILDSASPFAAPPTSFGRVTLENDLQIRYEYAFHCVKIAVSCCDYEALEIGVSMLKRLYENRREEGVISVPDALSLLVVQALWNQDSAVVVRLVQLGANLRIVHRISEEEAEFLGKPELAGTEQHLIQLLSYCYSDDEPIVSFIREEIFRQEILAANLSI